MLPWIRNSWAQGTAQASLVDMNVMRHKKTQTLHKEVSFFFSVILKLKISPCTFSPKHCIDFLLFLQIGCPIENYSSVGGIVVSIAAFQAVDPGSIPGLRSYHSFVLNTNICEQFLFNTSWFAIVMLFSLMRCSIISGIIPADQELLYFDFSILIFPFWFFHFDSLSMPRRYSTPLNFERFLPREIWVRTWRSFKNANMQIKHGSSMWSRDCYLKRCVKTV